MVNRVLLMLGVVLLNSCTAQQTLKDGITTVPPNGYVFKNKKKFTKDILQNINENYLYRLKERYYADSNFNKKSTASLLGAYYLQFYANGCVRGIDYLQTDTNISGYRGIVYLKNQQIYIDRAGLSSDRSLKIYTYVLKIEGNKIFLLEKPNTLFKPSEYTCMVYERSEKIPEDWKAYKADW